VKKFQIQIFLLLATISSAPALFCAHEAGQLPQLTYTQFGNNRFALPGDLDPYSIPDSDDMPPLEPLPYDSDLEWFDEFSIPLPPQLLEKLTVLPEEEEEEKCWHFEPVPDKDKWSPKEQEYSLVSSLLQPKKPAKPTARSEKKELKLAASAISTAPENFKSCGITETIIIHINAPLISHTITKEFDPSDTFDSITDFVYKKTGLKPENQNFIATDTIIEKTMEAFVKAFLPKNGSWKNKSSAIHVLVDKNDNCSETLISPQLQAKTTPPPKEDGEVVFWYHPVPARTDPKNWTSKTQEYDFFPILQPEKLVELPARFDQEKAEFFSNHNTILSFKGINGKNFSIDVNSKTTWSEFLNTLYKQADPQEDEKLFLLHTANILKQDIQSLATLIKKEKNPLIRFVMHKVRD